MNEHSSPEHVGHDAANVGAADLVVIWFFLFLPHHALFVTSFLQMGFYDLS